MLVHNALQTTLVKVHHVIWAIFALEVQLLTNIHALQVHTEEVKQVKEISVNVCHVLRDIIVHQPLQRQRLPYQVIIQRFQECLL